MRKEREINVFSISFIDVFCCALGAMILIFVLNNQALTSHVQYAVETARKKNKALKTERKRALKLLEDTRHAKYEAEQSKNEAIKEKNRALKAEQDTQKSRRQAENAKNQALLDKEAAVKSEQKSKQMSKYLAIALEEAQRLKRKAEISYLDIQEKNKQLEKANDSLQKMTREKRSQEDELKALLDQLIALRNQYKKTETIRKRLLDSNQKMEITNTKLNQKNIALERQYKSENQKSNRLEDQNSRVKSENQDLNTRLRIKERRIREKEKALVRKEQDMRQREEEIASQEKKISDLEKLLSKKVDKSLFGIQLAYRRILFVIDKSGSIIQNHWKQEVITTFAEVLKHCEVEEFAVIAFSSDTAFFPPQRGLMEPGVNKKKRKAVAWLKNKKRVRFGGATDLYKALRYAYEDYPALDAIFLLTDGLPYKPGTSSSALQKQILAYIDKKVEKGSKTKIITIAIGYPPATDNTQYSEIYTYLHKISKKTKGQYLGR